MSLMHMLTRPPAHHSANPALTRTLAPPRAHFRQAPTTPRPPTCSIGCMRARAASLCPSLPRPPPVAPSRVDSAAREGRRRLNSGLVDVALSLVANDATN